MSVAVRAQQAAPVSPAGAAFAQGVQLHDGGKPADAIALLQAGDRPWLSARQSGAFPPGARLARAGNTELALVELEGIAAAGFANTGVLSIADLDGLRALPRFKAFESRVNANARPCDNDPRFHAFDFWIGEWDVQPTGTVRAPIGQGATSIIEAQLGGCVIQENWMPNGPRRRGKSFNIYNTATSMWEQYYVDSRGTITHYKGAFKDDGNLLLRGRPVRSGEQGADDVLQPGTEPGAPARPHLERRRQDVDSDV